MAWTRENTYSTQQAKYPSLFSFARQEILNFLIEAEATIEYSSLRLKVYRDGQNTVADKIQDVVWKFMRLQNTPYQVKFLTPRIANMFKLMTQFPVI